MDNDLVLEGWPFNKKNDDRISMDEVNKIILERLEDICKKYNKHNTKYKYEPSVFDYYKKGYEIDYNIINPKKFSAQEEIDNGHFKNIDNIAND